VCRVFTDFLILKIRKFVGKYFVIKKANKIFGGWKYEKQNQEIRQSLVFVQYKVKIGLIIIVCIDYLVVFGDF
jgi:hypothetical protein